MHRCDEENPCPTCKEGWAVRTHNKQFFETLKTGDAREEETA